MHHPLQGEINSVRMNIVFMQNGLIKTLQGESPLLHTLTNFISCQNIEL